MKPKQGFTLIELLIVLTVIGILMGVLLPAIIALRGAVNGSDKVYKYEVGEMVRMKVDKQPCMVIEHLRRRRDMEIKVRFGQQDNYTTMDVREFELEPLDGEDSRPKEPERINFDE